MLFQFPPAIQAGIEASKYAQVFTSAGVPLSIARDATTGQFVGHAVGVLSNGAALNPLVAIPEMAMSAGQMYQMHQGFQAVQASLGVLQATTAVIGVGVAAGVALSAVNLHQTLKLKKAVERLELKVENGFINLEQALSDRGAEIRQLIEEVARDIKFEQHRLVLVRAYGVFTQAIHRLQTSMNLQDVNRRNAEIEAARGMLYEALADYTNPHLLEETCAAGQLRRLECAWAIEQTIIATYQVQNELAAVSDRLSRLQNTIRQNALAILDFCETEDELDFLFPEIKRIHDCDLAIIHSWQHQVDWMRSLPPAELTQLQRADFSKSEVRTEVISDTTTLNVPPEQLMYENLKQKSHPLSLILQIQLMAAPDLRQEMEMYVSKQSAIAGYKTLTPSSLQKASDLTIANLYWYFKSKDESEAPILS